MKGKRIHGLDCSAPGDQTIKFVLRSQLKAMCAMRGKALDWSDPEGVHDMRVLSRRLRSAISDFDPYLRKPGLPIAKLRTIAKSLGAVRDEDVALPALEELKSGAHGDVAAGIEMLIEERRERREKARAALEKAIEASEVTEFHDEFRRKLRDLRIVVPKKSTSQTASVTATFGSAGIEVINARLKELRAASRHIFFPFEIKELHEVRILAKRLRYAVELFESCWEKGVDSIAKEIALLQTYLGELHDCDVWIEDLGTRLRSAARRDRNEPDTIRTKAACTWLLRHFTKERNEHYRDALDRWQQWEAEEFLKKLTLH